MTTLLEQAMAAPVSKKKFMATGAGEQLDLAMAFAEGKITLSQVEVALGKVGKSKQNSHQWVGSTLLKAVRAGLLVRKE